MILEQGDLFQFNIPCGGYILCEVVPNNCGVVMVMHVLWIRK